MQPLPGARALVPLKTALLFFTGLAILVIIFLRFMINPIFKYSSNQSAFPARTHPIPDFVGQDRLMNKSWSKLLAKSGYQLGMLTQTVQNTLLTRQEQHQTIKWVSTKHCLILPAMNGSAALANAGSTGEVPLIRLGSRWKGMVESYGLVVIQEHWGYSHSKLWVKLVGAFRVKASKADLILPIQQMTIIQPLNHPQGPKFQFTGWIPSLNPLIPVEPIPQEIIPPGTIPPETTKPQQEPQPVFGGKPKAAIIIDDVGYQQEAAEEMLKIPVKLTWAILPFAPYSMVDLEAAKVHGLEVILHLPLEPIDRRTNPGPGVLLRDWPESRIVSQLNDDLAAVPGVIGVNNHMGSAGTQDGRLMGILMREMKQRGLFFIDSMTDANSVAEKYAESSGVPFAKRKVFIDNQTDLESKKAALRELIQRALKDGAAIGIAHARPGSAQAIMEVLPEFEKAGVELVPVSELVKVK